ncbi:Protein N-acetyltransferase, RimJ/RimL family [Flexibacter flexilis DSM 6793]|uniref:Protein N-acetyltransferase, RimJ/RimL family n=1 Tax=Flexibacter flexilis DSM 6793 TaxID=927664 RepID=A0A1I1KRC5_9BACT|nr:GNAT family N-acetyltransferase [Flexibacter flexilis]SFC60010.1 Protein N-acetyltransferase, RimJ/RimL family [Flexibacter flexilis DSM 6793]
MFNLRTKRLNIREFLESDTKFVINLLNSPTWIKNIGQRNIQNEAQAQVYIQMLRRNYQEQGYGFYLVERHEDQVPVGMCGLIKRETLPHTDIGFAFLPEHEGCGYGTESARTMLAYAQQSLGLETIAAITLPDNTQCIRLLEKIGFAFQQQIIHNNEQLLLFITH